MAKCIISYILTHSEQITRKYSLRNPVPVGFMFDSLRLDVLLWHLCIKTGRKVEREES